MDLFSFNSKSKKAHLSFFSILLTFTFFYFQNCSSNYEAVRLNLESSSLASLNPTNALPPSVTQIGGKLNYVCDPSQVAKTPATKLTNREFKTALFSMMDDLASYRPHLKGDSALALILDGMPNDSIASGHSTYKEQNFIQSQRLAKSYFDATFRVGEIIFGTSNDSLGVYPNTNQCLNSTTITQVCHQNFVKELASRAFRRTLNSTESNLLAASLWDSTLTKYDLLVTTFVSVLQMPDFLYRTYDQGTPSVRGDRVLTLTAHEVASKLSFFLTGKAPDATLRSLAASGQILDNTILSQQVDRLLATPDAQETIKRLFREMYGYDRFDSFTYSGEFLSGLDKFGLPNAMTAEMDTFFVDIVLNKKGTFSDLLTSQSTNISSQNLATVYGLATPGVTNLQSNRAGFINRAAFLARKSGNYTSPVRRGLAVLEDVLCEPVPPPPPNAPTSVSEEQIVSQLQSTRDRYTHLTETKGSSCIYCHASMNSIGYTFENFDSIGRYRSVEKIYDSSSGPSIGTVNINTQAEIPSLRPTPTVINDSTQLAYDLATNDKAIMCFVKNLKHFESRVPATAADGCQMNESLKTLYGANGSQGSIQNAIKNLILADDFKLWSY